MARGRVDLSKANPFIVNATLDCPGVARLKFKSQDDAEFVWGVAFSPDRIRTGGKRPADFDSFWMNAKAEYDRTVPVDVKLERLPRFCTTGQNAYRLSLTTPHGRIIDGVLTEPSDLDKGPYPVRLYVPGAGPSTGCPDESDGKIRLTMNVHYYPLVVGKMKRSKGNDELRVRDKREFDVYREKYGVGEYYFAGMAEKPVDYHYYDCILAINRAVNWLWSRVEVKKDDFRYQGTSQGGGMGLILAGINSHITRTVAYVPALTDLLGFKDNERASGWPKLDEVYFGTQRGKVEHNAPYFDAANFAANIRTPIRVVVGLSDTICSPCAVWAGYNAIVSADKGIISVPGMTHAVSYDVYEKLSEWLEE